MISMYTGSVGSGKSYHALELGLKVLGEKKHGMPRYVIANFPLKSSGEAPWFLPKTWRDKINANRKEFDSRWIFNDELSVEYLVAKSLEMGWYGKESMCQVIIDEAGIIFNSRDWQVAAASRNKWLKFLALSRKFGYDFVFITQADRMIDRQIRGMCEYEVKHLKANNSFFLSFLSIFKITLFMYVYQWYQTKMRGNLRMAKFKQSVANRYDTMRIFNFDDLIQAVQSLYQGKIIPAPVAAQLQLWDEEKVKRALEQAELEKETQHAMQEDYEAMLQEAKEKLRKAN